MALSTVWSKTGINNAEGIVTDASENVYVAYNYSSALGVAKLDANGVLLWSAPVTRAQWIGLDSNGNVYVGSVGYLLGDPMLLKFTNGGVLVWSVPRIESVGRVVGITIDPAGNCCVAGEVDNPDENGLPHLRLSWYNSEGASTGISEMPWCVDYTENAWDAYNYLVSSTSPPYSVTAHLGDGTDSDNWWLTGGTSDGRVINVAGFWWLYQRSGSIFTITSDSSGNVYVSYSTAIVTQQIRQTSGPWPAPYHDETEMRATSAYTITKFSPSHNVLWSQDTSHGYESPIYPDVQIYGSYWSPHYHLEPPYTFLTTDASQSLYGTKALNSLVSRWSIAGALIGSWNLALDADNTMIARLAVNPAGIMFVGYMWPGYLAVFDVGGGLIDAWVNPSDDDTYGITARGHYAYVCHWDAVSKINIDAPFIPRLYGGKPGMGSDWYVDGFIIGYQTAIQG